MSSQKSIQCPSCGQASTISTHRKRYALYPAGCLIVFGFPLALLHQASTPVDYECTVCSRKFSRRSRIAKVALTFVVVLILWTLAAFVLRLAQIQ